jgi:RNA polymerase sigma factor (sigma-70 family)
MSACVEGDSRAWRELVRRYRRLVYGIPLSLGCQPADADDIFQATFVELIKALPKFREPDRLEAWLVTTVSRAAVRLKQRERRRVHFHSRLGHHPGTRNAEPDLGRIMEGDRVLRALESLGEPCRTLLLGLFSDRKRSYRDLATELGLAVGSLGPTRARCLSRLRRQLQRDRLKSPGRDTRGDR